MTNLNMCAKYLAKGVAALMILSFTFGLTGCKEEIDESNFAIKSELTAADFIAADENYSSIQSIFTRVRLGNSEGASSIMSVLTARGNYTVFLPTNSAVDNFLKQNGVSSIDELNEEQLNLIAKSCIIDHNQDNAYETADFPTAGSFDKPNLNDRLLSCKMDSTSHYLINNTSHVIIEDNEVSNGFIHVVDEVVAPSALTLDKLISEADNMKVFAYLLAKTTWADSLYENLDLSYEDPDRPITYTLNNVAPFTNAQHRYIGYTAFVETDSVYESKLGLNVELDAEGNITNGDAFVEKLTAQAEAVYGSEAAGVYSDPKNALNLFVAYHLIHGKMAYNKLNHHNNEYNYKFGNDWKNPQRSNMPTNVWDYYTSMGNSPKLLKITQVGDAGFQQDHEHRIYVNRISKYANGPEDDYKETGFLKEGLLISSNNGDNDNNALNGYYYPINDLLFYTDDLATLLSQERIRVDVCAMLPELISNNFRGDIYRSFEIGYFDNISRESPDTKLLYLMCPGGGWSDYQGDEFMVSGLYDFTMKLPPVPKDGTYEIRMGVAHNSLRGMCQIYFGADPDRLMPAGLPYDMRQPGEPSNPAIPWIDDGEDWQINYEIDRNLRNQGYMKGPQYFHVTGNDVSMPVRRRPAPWSCLRRIITVAYMEADKDYYLRFKTALKKTDSQFFMDYFEFASTSVFNGPTAEDIW